MIDIGCDFAGMQDYIVGRLSDEQRRAFEDRLVREPRLVRELEHYLRMREGLQQLHARGHFAKPATPRRSSRLWLPAVAAAAGAGLVLFLWAHRSSAPSTVLMATLESHAVTDIAPAVAARFTFVSVRGSSAPDLELPAAGLIEIRAAPAAHMEAARYRMTLVRQNPQGAAEPVAVLGGLAQGSDGYIRSYAEASHLTPGAYVLRIEPDSTSAGVAESFKFTLRARLSGPSR